MTAIASRSKAHLCTYSSTNKPLANSVAHAYVGLLLFSYICPPQPYCDASVCSQTTAVFKGGYHALPIALGLGVDQKN